MVCSNRVFIPGSHKPIKDWNGDGGGGGGEKMMHI